MNDTNYQSVGDIAKTRDKRDKFAQRDQESFLRLQLLGYEPKIIFDIGASDGSWSKDIVEIFPSAEFHLFEPLIAHSLSYKTIIQDNLKQNPNFHLHELALGEKTREAIINIFPAFVASTALDMEGSELDVIPTKVPMTTVDNLVEMDQLPFPQVIKIDTQGYELAILKGAVKTLPQVDILLIECWFYRGYGKKTPLLTEIANWLLPFGFRLWDVGEVYRNANNVLGTLDCMFVNINSGIAPSWYYDT
jgi:FkbM family methyltransferase